MTNDKNRDTTNATEDVTYHNQGRIAFYHANSKGTGAALRFEFKPPSGRRNGCIFMEMAQQKTMARGGRGQQRTPATFNWEAKATVKLSFMDTCEFLAVLQLKQPSLGSNGKGLYHVNGDKDTLIGMRTNTERKGYTIGISRKDKQGTQIFKGHFLLSPTEAIGLEAILSAALFHMAFGQVQPVAA